MTLQKLKEAVDLLLAFGVDPEADFELDHRDDIEMGNQVLVLDEPVNTDGELWTAMEKLGWCWDESHSLFWTSFEQPSEAIQAGSVEEKTDRLARNVAAFQSWLREPGAPKPVE